MKRALTLSLAAFLAFPLFAEEPKKADPPATDTAAPAPASNDSPLVQAAKRTNRLGRKGTSKVITNESLKGSKGHITTTTAQHPVNFPEPQAGPEAKLAKAKAAKAEAEKVGGTGAEKDQKPAASREKKLAAAAGAAEDAGYDVEDADPAQAEKAADEQKPPV